MEDAQLSTAARYPTETTIVPIRRALISVSEKAGVVDLARGLHAHGVELISTGGTARLLEAAGLPVTEVAQLTGFAEMLDGRVKTLHPTVHAGLLARREVAAHMQALSTHEIAPIDLLVVQLYPFEATVARAECSLEDAIENIDIGGPAMIRSGAKNWRGVAVLTDPSQYAKVLEQLEAAGGLADPERFTLAVAAFNRIADYDAAISDWLSALQPDGTRSRFPEQVRTAYVKVQSLRYGENPHQEAAYYRDRRPAPGSLTTGLQVQGKELSYNNLADADTAWECVKSFSEPACVIVKHANPCGVAQASDCSQAYARAFATDPTSAFGGIIAFNRPLDGATAAAVARQFVEVLIAPEFSDEARAVFASKPNTRLLAISLAGVEPGAANDWARGRNAIDSKRVGSGILLQTADNHELSAAELRVVTRQAPSAAQLADLLFAWRVAKYVKSNAIVFCSGLTTLGIGAGQMSRVDSARIAAIKAASAQLALSGSVVASDAFFPFRDGLDVVVDAGAVAVIQPGGSVRDAEVIAAADERGVAMVFTNIRHFRH